MKIIVMIPAYNEASTIAGVIKSIPRNIANNVEILVVDDGSKDNTSQIAKEAGADKIARHPVNRGLGTAFRTGLENAIAMKADIIVNIDADGQFNPADISRLVQPIIDGNADMVTCSRFLLPAYVPKMPWIKKLGNKTITGLINFLTGKNFTDTQCGFRAYSREAALRLNLFGEFTYTQEVFLDLLNKGLRIREIPCKLVHGQRKGKSRIYKGWFNYGTRVLLIIVRSIRDYRPLTFFGIPGIISLALGLLVNLFLFFRWVVTAQISPYRSLVIIAISLIILGFLFMVLALISDMLSRQRKIQEEMLYRLKKNG